MPNTYVHDVKEIVDTLSKDDGLTLEGRLVLLSLMTDYITVVTKQLEDELARGNGDQRC